MSVLPEILGHAWQAAGGDGREPLDREEFERRLAHRVQPVLEASFNEDMTEWRDRLREVGDGLAPRPWVTFWPRFPTRLS